MVAKDNLPVVPNPSLIIPLGNQSIKIIASTMPIYFRSDERREKLTEVGAPVILSNGIDGETTSFGILDFPQIRNLDFSKKPLSDISINELFINLNTLIYNLEITWHALRSHESFIEAGLSGEKIPNLNVIVLADLWDQTACLSLLPVLYQLKKLSNNSTNSMIHVLLTTAKFPSEIRTNIQKARMYRVLTELDRRILPEKALKNDPILKGLNLDDSMSLDYMRFYLFDTIKEREVTVSGREELNAILGNFILTLLNGEISDTLTESLTQELMGTNRTFFASAGATSIVYNPEPIVEYCAARLGAEYLPKDYWPNSGNDKSVVDSLLENIRQKIGKENDWISKIISRTIFSLVQIEDKWDIKYSLEDLILESPRADKIKECRWGNAISEYHDLFVNQKLPITINEIDQTSLVVQQELDELQVEFDLNLIQQVELHPNILFNGRAMLFAWKKELEYKIEKIDELLALIPSKEDQNKRYVDGLQNLNEALDGFPPPLWFFKFIPECKIKSVFLSIYSFLKLRAHYRNLDNAANNLKSSLTDLAVSPVKNELLNKIRLIYTALITRVDETYSAFDALEKKLKNVQTALENEYPKHIPGVSYLEGYANFQIYPANQDFTLDCYKKYAPQVEDIRLGLLESKQFLKDWQTKDELAFTQILMEFGRKAFSSISDLKIEEVLKKTMGSGLDSSKLTQEILRISESTLFLLNPNWDFGESYGGMTIQTCLIDCDNNPLLSPLISDKWQNQKIVYSNDPYYYSFAKIQSQIPLQAVGFLIEPGKLCWNHLTHGEQQSADILPSQAIIDPKVTVNEVEDSDGDLINKTFRWTFEPKGSSTSIEQEIVLQISRKRFDGYKSKPRFNQEYNRYSEEEMPEIRDLALAFQELHRTHNWSTYNQAFNILTFVQSCIPYSFDKDTTPYSDWARYPIETLMDGTGDCEDVAILCGAVLARLGFSSALFLYPSHLAFGVQAADGLKGDYVVDEKTNKKFYYGEATAKGWRLGEIPSEYKNTPPIKIYPIVLTVSE